MTGTPKRNFRLTTAALLTTLLAVSGLPPSSASGAGYPEISDGANDVQPAAYIANTPEAAHAFTEAKAYDLRAVYVSLETERDFSVSFKVEGMPAEWDAPAEFGAAAEPGASPEAPPTPQPATTLVAIFDVKGSTYEVMAVLRHPNNNGLQESYSIQRLGAAAVPAEGRVDVPSDTVTIVVPKALVGAPRAGDKLERFRAEGRFDDVKLDFAPNAQNAGAPTPPSQVPTAADTSVLSIVLEKLDGEQQVVNPNFGRDYVFDHRPGSGSVALSAAQATLTATAGEKATYTITVKNRGSLADVVYLTLSTAGPTYAHKLGAPQLDLAAGEEKTVSLEVTTSPAASSDAITIAGARSELGGSSSLVINTRIRAASSSSEPPQDRDGDGQPDVAPPDPSAVRPKGKSPTASLGALAALAVASALIAQRRRR